MENSEKHKYQTLMEYIVKLIESGEIKKGEQIYSENELAEKFNLSRHTVRKAIGGLVNEGWLKRVQGKGTFVNDKPNNEFRKPKIIGVMISYLNDYIFPSIVQGIESRLSKEEYSIFLSCTYNQYEKERICLENLLNQDIAGLIVETTKGALPNPNLELYRKIKSKGVPILFIHGTYNGFEVPYVTLDDLEASYMATNYLIKKGHKNIGGIFKFDYKQGHLRFQGFQNAMNKAKLNILDENIIWFDDDDIDYQLNGQVNHKINKMLAQSSAVVCYNDQIAVRFMESVKTKGLNIPNDISVIGFDDSAMAVAVEPKLTTIVHPQEKLGIKAAEMMLEMIFSNKNVASENMKPILVERDSVKEFGGI